jgi:hypothetical protein
MADYMDVFLSTTEYIKNNHLHTYMLFGPVQFRFFRTNKFQCVNELYSKTSLFKGFKLMGHSMQCHYIDHYDDKRNKTSFYAENLYNYSFVEQDKTGIEHYLSTPVGTYDRSGIVINISTIK